MKNLSLGAILLVTVVLAGFRLQYLKWDTPAVANVLTWDAFGYYLDLPGIFIYGDIDKLEWLPACFLCALIPSARLFSLFPC